MGGEVTGSIDESVRHVVTKLAHLHFPATELSARRIRSMGEAEENIHVVGCPRIDEVKRILTMDAPLDARLLERGVGQRFDLSQPFFLVSFHPVTTEYGDGEEQVREIIDVVDKLEVNTIMLWPNVDAGSDDVARGIRGYREINKLERFHFFKSLPMEMFISLMDKCSCIVGNSSSAIREGAFIGVPAVNVGSRQLGRERGENVIDVGVSKDEIRTAIEYCVEHGKYKKDTLYGDGNAAKKIMEILRTQQTNVQKTFVDYPEIHDLRNRST